MNKTLNIFFITSFLILSGCSSNIKNENFISFGEKTDNLIERLEKANIEYKVQGNEIHIKEKDLKRATNCCT